MQIDSKTAQQILLFWFGELKNKEAKIPEEIQKRWFTKDKQLDAQIRQDYLSLWQAATLESCLATLHDSQLALAQILVLDQFSRNMHRDTPQAFEKDPLTQRLATEMTEQKLDKNLHFTQRVFVYMPFMHAENMDLQNLGLQCFQQLADEAKPEFKAGVSQNIDFMQKHLVIIKRFGRFPHRNQILGRVSSAEEIEFLKQPDSSF